MIFLNCKPSNFKSKISNFLDNYSQDYDAITFYGYWKKLIPVDKDIINFQKMVVQQPPSLYGEQRAYDDFIRVFTDSRDKMQEELKTFKGNKKFETPYAIERTLEYCKQWKEILYFRSSHCKTLR